MVSKTGSEKDDHATQQDESEIVFKDVFMTGLNPTEILLPGEQTFNLPAVSVARRGLASCVRKQILQQEAGMSHLDFKSEEEKARILAEQKEKTPRIIIRAMEIRSGLKAPNKACILLHDGLLRPT